MTAGDRPPERVRVLRLVGRLNIGGPARQILPLCRDLDARGFETVLFIGETEEWEGEALKPFLGAGVWIERVPSLGRRLRPWSDARAVWRLSRAMRSLRPRILHTHLAKGGLVGRVAGALGGVPIRIHTFHGTNFRGHFGRLASWASRWAERCAARFSTHLVAVSRACAEDLIDAGIGRPEAISVLEPGLDLEPFLAVEGRSGTLRKRFSVPEADPLVGWVGRLTPVKDPASFVDLAAAVLIADPRAHFAILGDGPLRSDLARQAEMLGVSKRVHLAGWQEGMPACLADLDLVVSTSRSEGMPISLIEALAAARPVAARAVGGIPELVLDGRTGYLVPPDSESGLEERVLDLLGDDGLRVRMGREGRESVRNRFAAERLVGETEELYRRLLASSNDA